jgi:hypothetical protein
MKTTSMTVFFDDDRRRETSTYLFPSSSSSSSDDMTDASSSRGSLKESGISSIRYVPFFLLRARIARATPSPRSFSASGFWFFVFRFSFFVFRFSFHKSLRFHLPFSVEPFQQYSSIMSTATEEQRKFTTLFALDFDGVLVDSAAETGLSGWMAARTLWPDSPWMERPPAKPSDEKTNNNALTQSQKHPMPDLIERFRQVRPCLETGWEASLIIRLLADPEYGQPSNDEIVHKFQSVYKERLLQDSQLTPEQCNQALKEARSDWIALNNGQDWIQAHGFFEGACQAIRTLLETEGSGNVYIITTKAKEFALRLLEKQGLYYDTTNPENASTITTTTTTNSAKTTTIPADHIYGLGSGPKAAVLTQLLLSRNSRQQQQRNDRNCVVAVMVEDNLSTLRKILASPELKGRVLPALASWGYNTTDQQQQAMDEHLMVLDSEDSSSLSRVLDPTIVPVLLQDFVKH